MSDLLSIGASGARTYQTALGVASENIANAATPGYSRRSALIREVGRTNSIAIGQTVKLSGSGSHVTGVTRASDSFKSAEVRSSGADLARTEAGVVWIDRIEGALVGNQLSDRLSQFFASAKNLAADPAATAPRTVLLEDARSLAAGFASTAIALDSAAAELDAQGKDAATELGDLAQSLVRINRGLTRASANSAPQAQLLDERDRLLDAMTGITNINVAFDDYGRAIVRAGGATGPVIADLENAALISFASSPTGAVAISASHADTTSMIEPSGGMLAGLIDGAGRIAAARESLNVLAKDFTDQTTALQANGRTLDNTPGVALFEITGTDATTMLVNPLIDARGIAAAAVGEGARGNGNMTALANLRIAADWEGTFDDVVTENAALLATRRNVAEAQGSIHSAAVAARDGAVGVDLDEEAVNLIRFQQAYQASSRVIQVARDILQTIIDIR
ncbi:flagellar hook-associated protein 1 FlgK [Sphingomonas guangdongensis]|uniref:Flagellar hook-associated protein 1 n=1 Tax=Sphingomonas guangdongensis TaxID=1141890 RepID=A0A285QJF9_9SPHN|nr:flagellar hook-associated protein FlgK [Sphingomonas guangdongensis]SOB80212.1 flagellar hook-associated protein 1 FlgK [Sphingomonas guangdongensis]